MAFTTDQYNKLVDAISQGVFKVKYADKEVEYRNMNDMIRLKSLMEKDLGLKNIGPITKLARFKKGLESGGSVCFENDFLV